MARKKKKQTSQRIKLQWIAVGVCVAIVTVVAGLFAVPVVFAGRVMPNVFINKTYLGGVRYSDLGGVLAQYGTSLVQTKVTLRLRGTTHALPLKEIGFTLDQEATMREVLPVSFSAKILKPQHVQPILRMDARQARSQLHNVFSEVLTLPQNASLRQVGGDFVLVPSVPGEQVDIVYFEQNVLSQTSRAAKVPVDLRVVTDVAAIENYEVDASKRLVAELLKNGFTLTLNEEQFVVKPNTLQRMLQFGEQSDPLDSSNVILGIQLDQEELTEYLTTTVAPQIDREPVNARFVVESLVDSVSNVAIAPSAGNSSSAPTFVDGAPATTAPGVGQPDVSTDIQETLAGSTAEVRVEQFAAPQEGTKLNVEQSIESIERALTQGQTSSSLAVDVTQPIVVENATADNFGITTLLAVGESDFRGSPKNRIHNIVVGAARYHGLLIAPNEEFSFNRFLGPVTAEAGFKPELVIKTNVTVPEYGGGLCQVSTTAFRAAINAGLKIIQRKNHAYAVSYYGKPGFDATIYPPYTDLRFLNNTPGYILIQTKIEATRLIFEFWGTGDGRDVEVVGPTPYNRMPDGAVKATLKQRVMRDGEIIIEDTFYSNYKSPKLFPKVVSANAPIPPVVEPTPTATPTQDDGKKKNEKTEPTPKAKPSATPSRTPPKNPDEEPQPEDQ